MDFGRDKSLWRFKWHTVIIYIALIVMVLLTVFTDTFRTAKAGTVPQLVWLLSVSVLLIAILAMLSKVFKMLDALEDNGTKLERVNESLEKIRAVLVQLNQNVRLSETARTIAFRDADKQALREAVFDKLQQQDFDTTFEIIDEISHFEGCQELASQLSAEAKRYRDATDAERVNQVITHIEKLLDEHQWAKASAQIERLIRAEPASEKAKAMRQRLLDKKEERKKILLTAWDDAVKRQATDRSLEILRELDMYLTPNEGLALQEAARDVFRNKLHNLGVRFALAVSGKQWSLAVETGQEIIHDFPNSRMAEEIRGKMDVLRQKADQTA